MHKRIATWVVVAIMIFIIASLAISIAHADTSSSWITSALSLQKQADTTTPSSLYGNIDCAMEDTNTCSVPTSYGAATSNSTVRLNNEGLSLDNKGTFSPVYTYIENRQRFFPAPNSNEAISYTSGPVYGLYLYFNYNFSASIVRTGGFGTLQPVEYHINRPPDGKLADKANHLLPADITSMNFSSNGQWMVVSDPNVAMLRVNLQTFEVLPFAPSFNYTIGLDPGIKTAITNDGRYAVVASQNFNSFKLYDLSTCSAVPDVINGPAACQSRDLQAFVQQQIAGYSFATNIQFMDNDMLAFYGVYKLGNTNKTARFTVNDNGALDQLDYLALGDSYISGEGAFDYASGTDTDINKCHLSYLSYPFLAGQQLNYNSYHSVACSGATTNDITNESSGYIGQAGRKNRTTRLFWDKSGQTDIALSSFIPGYIDQLEFVKRYQPKAITLSIGGNDVNMIGTLKRCFKLTTCMNTYEDRLDFVNQVNGQFSEIKSAYESIKKAGPPDMRIYAIGYPQVVKPGGDCGLNVHLNSDEVIFTSQAINYLNLVVKTAAAQAGVFYVDAEDALYGHRLCEAGPGSAAVNGITAGNDIIGRLNGPLGNESFHPNPFGHQLIKNKVLQLTRNLSAPMPPADSNAVLPSQDGLDILNAPRSGRALNTTEFDPGLSPDLAYQQTSIDISIDGAEHSLAPGIDLKAEIHSDPISLGSYKTDSNGNLSTQITIPANVPAGYHSLHFYGADINGQSIDIYKDFYIASTADDFDGNGILDSAQKCIGVDASGQDFDQDGVDDACDGNITQPPAAQSSSSVLGSVSSNTDSLIVDTAPTAAGGKPNSNINKVAFASSNPSQAQPKVLGASTNKPSPNDSNNLRLSNSYFAGAGLSVFILSAVAYALKGLFG